MPVYIEFSDDKSHIIYEFAEPLEMRELLEAYQKEKAYRDAVQHTVHSIVDMSKIKRVPPNWLTAKAGPGLTHTRSGRMLFVGISHGLRIIIQTILKIARYNRMVFFATREEAEAYMARLVAAAKNGEREKTLPRR
jgi:hypothetical protein